MEVIACMIGNRDVVLMEQDVIYLIHVLQCNKKVVNLYVFIMPESFSIYIDRRGFGSY